MVVVVEEEAAATVPLLLLRDHHQGIAVPHTQVATTTTMGVTFTQDLDLLEDGGGLSLIHSLVIHA